MLSKLINFCRGYRVHFFGQKTLRTHCLKGGRKFKKKTMKGLSRVNRTGKLSCKMQKKTVQISSQKVVFFESSDKTGLNKKQVHYLIVHDKSENR